MSLEQEPSLEVRDESGSGEFKTSAGVNQKRLEVIEAAEEQRKLYDVAVDDWYNEV